MMHRPLVPWLPAIGHEPDPIRGSPPPWRTKMSSFQWLPLLAGLLAATPPPAEQPSLEVAVLVIGEDGRLRPAPEGVTVGLRDTRPPVRAERHGDSFKLEPPGTASSPLRLEVGLKGYSLCTPAEVVTSHPDKVLPKRVTVLLRESSSLEQVACGERLGMALTQQVNWRWLSQRRNSRLEPDYFIESWCRRHDLDPEATRAILEQWAREPLPQASRTRWRQAIIAFIRGDYRSVVEHATQLANEERTRPQGGEPARVTRTLILQGVAHNASGEHAQALQAYGQVLQLTSTQPDEQAWASARAGAAYAFMAQGLTQEGRLEPLQRASSSYRDLLKVYTRERAPALWAAVQDNLGLVLLYEARLSDGEARLKALNQARSAFQRALEIYTPQAYLREWILVQQRLGLTLQFEGQVLAGPETLKRFSESETMLRAALRWCHDRKDLWECAPVYNLLGNALVFKGESTTGVAGVRQLSEAADVYRESIDIYRKKSMPSHAALGQTSLGNTLLALSKRLPEPEGIEALRGAVSTYQEARSGFRLAQEEREAAQAQYDLAGILHMLGERVQGRERLDALEQAERELLGALHTYTRKDQPDKWAMTIHRLGLNLVMRAMHTEARRPDELLARTVNLLKEPLAVFTREQAPVHWEAATNLSCIALMQRTFLAKELRQARALAEEARQSCGNATNLSTDERLILGAHSHLKINTLLLQLASTAQHQEESMYLREVISHVREGLKSLKREQAPQAWSLLQIQLGAAIMLQSRLVDAAQQPERLRLWKEATQAFYEAQRGLALSKEAPLWLPLQHTLGHLLVTRGFWLEGEEAIKCFQGAVPQLQGVLFGPAAVRNPGMTASARLLLCLTTSQLGVQLTGERGRPWLQRAVSACEEALEHFDPYRNPAPWNQAKANLYTARLEQLTRSRVHPPDLRLASQEADTGVSPYFVPVIKYEGRFPAYAPSPPASHIWLNGRVLLVSKGDTRAPSPSAVIRYNPSKVEVRTAPGSGWFRLPIPSTLQPGERLDVSVSFGGYELNLSDDEHIMVPENKQGVTIELRPVPALRALATTDVAQRTDAFAKEGLRQLLTSVDPGLELSALLAQEPGAPHQPRWAVQPPEQLAAQIQESLALLEKSYGSRLAPAVARDPQKQKLDDVIKETTALLEQSKSALLRASQQDKEAEVLKARGQVYQNLLWLAKLHMEREDFDDALKTYRQALEHAPDGRDANTWASLHRQVGLALMARADLLHGETMVQCSDKALQHLSLASRVFSKSALPEEWARTQLFAGVTRMVRGQREGGEEAVRWLGAAETDLVSALDLFEAEHLPLDAALARDNLGHALSSRALFQERAEAKAYLREAVRHHELAMKVLTRERAPDMWAVAHVRLAHARSQLGFLLGGLEGERLLVEAESSFNQALSVVDSPLASASIRAHYGTFLAERGYFERGKRQEELLRNAASISDQVLESVQFDSQPHLWAMAKNSRGLALLGLAALHPGEGTVLLDEAQRSFKAALDVFSRKYTPHEWARAQHGLCVTQQRLEGPPQAGRAEQELEAVRYCQAALEVSSYVRLPHLRASVETALGGALLALGQRQSGRPGKERLREAMGAYERVAKARTPEHEQFFDWSRLASDMEKVRQLLGPPLR